MWEINGVCTDIFEAYLDALSKNGPSEYIIVIIDNAGFHSTKNIKVPANIHLLNTPPHTPELNPFEQIWQYLKNRFKNQLFGNMKNLRNQFKTTSLIINHFKMLKNKRCETHENV